MNRLRIVGSIAVLLAAANIAAASAHTGSRHGQGAVRPPDLRLTYTKWIAPGFPNMVGVVGGDIVGTFGGAVYERTVDPTGRFVHLSAIYIVIAPDPARSFAAHVEGTEDLQTLKAVLDGRVVDGYLTHARVHVRFTVISCAQAPSGTCFQGSIIVRQGSQD